VPAATEKQSRLRWFVLALIGVAQLMVVLDATIVNIALPSAQADLGFSDDARQWIITAYALSFGSLLLLGGRLGDLLGRKRVFVLGLTGFAAASAVGGFAPSFGVLVIARALQGVFAALLAPAALSLLTTTFIVPEERNRAFGIFGTIAASGAAVGLILGGALTQYLDWRWSMFINVLLAVPAALAALRLLDRDMPASAGSRIDVAGTVTASAGLFALVFGFSNAETHGWSAPVTIAAIAAGVGLLGAFVAVERRVANPLLPMRVVADRNRSAGYLAVATVGAGLFGVFLFLTYYMQQTLGFSPVVTGLAFLPMVGCIMVASTMSNIVLMPRVGPRPLAPTGMLLAAAGLAWLTGIGVHSSYATAVLPPSLVIGVALGLVFAPVFNTGTFGVAPHDAGVASATINTGQQLGGSIGTSLLNTIFASTVASYIAAHLSPATAVHGRPSQQLTGLALIHGYTTAFWWSAAILAFGAIVALTLFRSGPLTRPAGPAHATGTLTAADQDPARGTALP
jgi:EmrB/QacA subfamily drug resistance transporter